MYNQHCTGWIRIGSSGSGVRKPVFMVNPWAMTTQRSAHQVFRVLHAGGNTPDCLCFLIHTNISGPLTAAPNEFTTKLTCVVQESRFHRMLLDTPVKCKNHSLKGRKIPYKSAQGHLPHSPFRNGVDFAYTQRHQNLAGKGRQAGCSRRRKGISSSSLSRTNIPLYRD